MTMITPSYLGETIEYSSLHACRSTLEDPTLRSALSFVRRPRTRSASRWLLPSQRARVPRLMSVDFPRAAPAVLTWLRSCFSTSITA